MIGSVLTPTHLALVLVVALLVLGPKRLPAAGRSLGEAMRGFKDALASVDLSHTTEHPRRESDVAPALTTQPAASRGSEEVEDLAHDRHRGEAAS